MLHVPKWLGDTMDRMLQRRYYQAQVLDTRYLTPDLKLVSFGGDLEAGDFAPGQELIVRVGDCDYRHYTICTYDAKNAVCKVLFYLNSHGPGSHWADALEPGDEVKFITDGGKIKYDEAATHHFFFGDETALGLFNRYKQLALQRDDEYFGVLELKAHNLYSVEDLQLLVDAVPAHADQPAVEAIQWMEDMHPDCWESWKRATWYLAGRSISIQRFSQYLQSRGIVSKKIRTLAYWADGKIGL